jgi:hypothetical protein
VIVGWLGVVIAVVAGIILAGLAAFGVINAASNGADNGPISGPLFVYGSR